MNKIQNDNIIIDDDNIDNVEDLIEDMRKLLKYTSCKNVIEFVGNKLEYSLKPPLYLNELNKMLLLKGCPKRDIKLKFDCKKCSMTNNLYIYNILTKRIPGVNDCQGCKTIINYNKITNKYNVDEIHSIRKQGTEDIDENKILFSDVENDLSLKSGIKCHDYIYLYCDMCPGLRSNTVGKVFKEESKNRTCKSCLSKISNAKLENNGKLPDNFVIEKSYKVKNGWKQSNKIKEDLSIENQKLKEALENLNKSIETSSNDLFITQNNVQDLELIPGKKIEYRNSDGYINITQLCRAAGKGKEFKRWKEYSKTKPFLEALSHRTLRAVSDLIHVSKGGGDKNKEHKTWVHPYVAINIAQWASPDFAAQVCIWVFEIIVTGKVDSSNLTDYNILQEKFQKSLEELEVLQANKLEDKKRIKELEKKCLKKIKRTQYGKGYMIYIVQAENDKESGIYKLGKSQDLTSRMSTYNTCGKHDLMFNFECHTEALMDIIEKILFVLLDKYRIEQNHEKFILPENKDITYIKNIIKNVVEPLTIEI